MSEDQAQCWTCPLCHDDRQHEPGSAGCLAMQASGYQGLLMENEQLRARVAEYEALTDEMDAATRHCYLSGPTVVGQFKRLRQASRQAGGEQ